MRGLDEEQFTSTKLRVPRTIKYFLTSNLSLQAEG